MKRLILLIILFFSCKKDPDVVPPPSKELVEFNSEIVNSIWVLKEIEFLNQINTYSDTLKFLEDSVLIYNSETHNI